MSSRFLIPMLCVGAVAFACGPRTHNEAAAQKSGKTVAHAASAVTQQGAPRAGTKEQQRTPIAADLFVHASASAVRLALHVANTGKRSVEITFPGGQTYDFVVLDSVGRELWRWGNGRMFTQALRNKALGRGETLDMEATWQTAALPPGRYTARAVLTSVNYPMVRQTQFIVTATTVASR